MLAEPCKQWPKGLCRRHTTCKYYHSPLDIPPLRTGRCSWLKNGAKRCESTASYNENDQPLCFSHTEAGRISQSQISGDKRALVVPERATKRVSGKCRMVNPHEVGYRVGGEKKQDIDRIQPGLLAVPSKPLIVDIGSAQGRFLIQLAQLMELDSSQQTAFNYVGFELRSTLVDAANEVVQGSDTLRGKVVFLQGDAKSNMADSLAPLLLQTHASAATTTPFTEEDNNTTSNNTSAAARIEWLTIQFPDPWTKKKHHKRRLVDAAFVQLCAEIMPHSDCKIYICSDRYDLACYMYDTFAAAVKQWRPMTGMELAAAGYGKGEPGATRVDIAASAGHVEVSGVAGCDEDYDEEEGAGEGNMLVKNDVYREMDADDTRFWLKSRPFIVGTERDSVAEMKNRPVHRAVFLRVVNM